MGREKIAMHGLSKDALVTFGGLIREARIRKGWTQKHLAGVAMTTPRTVSLIERGHPAVSIGTAFTVATAAGAYLFQVEDPEELARLRFSGQQKLALMPKRVVEQEPLPLASERGESVPDASARPEVVVPARHGDEKPAASSGPS